MVYFVKYGIRGSRVSGVRCLAVGVIEHGVDRRRQDLVTRRLELQELRHHLPGGRNRRPLKPLNIHPCKITLENLNPKVLNAVLL